MKRLVVIPLVAVLLGGGVASAAPAAPAAPAAAGSVTCPTGWGSLPRSATSTNSQPLTNVRAGAHPCFDRLVLDVPGTSAAHPVGYHVQYVDTLYQDGSGRPIAVRGGAVLEIYADAPSYSPATGTPTYPGRAGQPLPGVDLTGYRTFVEAKFASSFEGRTQLGLGVRARLPFQVFQLDDRLVIDVAHSWTATP
ncbi:AMIN-like domain-containing (lipo)protein [Kitasatospora sp. NPDC004289]